METEIKITVATSHFQIWLTCPHCDDYQERSDDLKEYLDPGSLSSEKCDAHVKCNECHNEFIVESIEY